MTQFWFGLLLAGLLVNASHFFAVTAVDGNGLESGYSNELAVTNSGSVTLTWDSVAGAVGYRVYEGSEPGSYAHSYATTNNWFTAPGTGRVLTVAATGDILAATNLAGPWLPVAAGSVSVTNPPAMMFFRGEGVQITSSVLP